MQYKELRAASARPRALQRLACIAASAQTIAKKYDLALIKAEVRCAAAGVYTTNKVCGAPIKVDRAHLKGRLCTGHHREQRQRQHLRRQRRGAGRGML